MLLELTLEQALHRLGETRKIFDETMVPNRSDPVSHSPYLPQYDWLFLYERKLARVLDPWLQSRRLELIGSGGLLSEALSNAYCHAHGRNADLPIRAQIFQGESGLVVRLKDSGSGFAIQDIVKKYHAKAAYYHVAGNGLRRMIESDDFGVFFTEQGTAFHLLYVFNTPLRDWNSEASSANPLNRITNPA